MSEVLAELKEKRKLERERPLSLLSSWAATPTGSLVIAIVLQLSQQLSGINAVRASMPCGCSHLQEAGLRIAPEE